MSDANTLEPPSDTVQLKLSGGVAVLRIDNPPVNGMGNTVRAGLFRGLEFAIADPLVRAVVITGAGRLFSGGADIRQFNTPAATERPMSRDVQALIREAGKPVVAAIHGSALGGGLELAMACHWRIAHVDAQVGLPEVKLGLIPGGGGTQRLPRLVGARQALEMIVHGRSIRAPEAMALALLDATCTDDVVLSAISFALEKALSGAALPDLHGILADCNGVDFSDVRAALDPLAPNHKAQKVAVQCVELACTIDLDAGMTVEREAFFQLLEGPESKALREQFFAERRAAKLEAQKLVDATSCCTKLVKAANR